MLPLFVALVLVALVYYETLEPRPYAFDIFLKALRRIIEVDEDHRKEDNVRQKQNNDQHTAPLQPNDFADPAIYRFGGVGLKARIVGRQAGTIIRVTFAVAPDVL